VSSAAVVIFLIALFLAIAGATAFVVAARRGVFSDRPPDDEQR
jgi:hypothetical protein